MNHTINNKLNNSKYRKSLVFHIWFVLFIRQRIINNNISLWIQKFQDFLENYRY